MNGKLLTSILLVSLVFGCGHKSADGPNADNLQAARKAFATKLTTKGPAPQPFQNEQPPIGVKEVQYASGELRLKGWLSESKAGGKKLPAVVFLHGGFAFGGDDWADAAPFANAGFILFMPTLRGENGNPGNYESFWGEVDDAVAAGKFVASLPEVDSERVFVCGHSVGGMLSCLVSMVPSPFKAAASFDGHTDMDRWIRSAPDSITPYDRKSAEEIRVRNPIAFAASIRCPLRLYAGEGAKSVNTALAEKAKTLGKPCDVVVIGGEHHAMVAPAVKQAITWFQSFPAK